MRVASKVATAGAAILVAGSSAGVLAPWSPAAASAVPRARAAAAVARTPGSGTLVSDWNKELVTILETTKPPFQPAAIHPTRSLAIVQAAELDAVASTTDDVAPYLFTVPAPPDARPDAAAAQAAHDALVGLFPAAAPQVDALLQKELAQIPDSTGKTDGTKVGATVARILGDVRSFDGADVPPPPVTPGTQAGQYRPTPDRFPKPVFTGWGSVTPFVLDQGSQFRPAPPPAVDSPAYAKALREVQSLGEDTSVTRTADQTAAAKFWAASPIWITWNQIAQTLSERHKASLVKAASAFGDLDLSLSDATFALYDAKYHYYVWRPITAIRQAATDPYNTAIAGNAKWEALAQTAADPSYPGAHSTLSEAAATVLVHFFPDHEPLTVTSDSLAGVHRSFDSIMAASDEAGLSRIFAGQHTRLDHVAGQALGSDVAQFVLGQLDSTP